METDSLSLAASFFGAGNPHDVMGFTDAGIMERRMFRHHVAELLQIINARPHARVVMELSRYYLMRVTLQTAMFVTDRIILVGDNVSDPCLRQYLNDDDILITDCFRGFSCNVIDLFTTLTFISSPEQDEKILAAWSIPDTSRITVALFGGDTGVSVKEYATPLSIMEQQCRDQIRGIPELSDVRAVVSSFKPSSGFGFSHGLVISMLLDIPMYDRQLLKGTQISLLGIPDYAFITSMLFLGSLGKEDVIAGCRLILVNGFFEKMIDYMAVSSVADCPVVESLGTLTHGVIALRRLSEGRSFHFVAHVNYRIDEDGVLVCNSYFDGANCNYPTEYTVQISGRDFIITGRRRRLVEVRGVSYNMDDMEHCLERAGFGDRVAVFEFSRRKEKEKYIVIAVESEELFMLSGSDDIENRGLAADYVNEIRNELISGGYPEELLPRKVRFVRKISYNEFGRPDYERLKQVFSLFGPDKQSKN